MKKYLIPLLSFFLLTFAAQAQDSSSTAARKYPSLLWQITRTDIPTTSYLYGTIHVTDSRVFEFADSVMAKFYSCDAVATEILMDKIDYLGMMKTFVMHDVTLRDLYTPEQYTKVRAYLVEKMGPLAIMFNIDKIKPFYLMSLASEMGGKDKKKTTNKDKALDIYLSDLGAQNGMLQIGIETITEQFDALDRIPLKEQAQMLLDATQTDNEQMDMDELIQIYQAQNIDALLAYYKQNEGTEGSGFDVALVENRNKVMAHRMDSIMHQQSTFMAVGTLHLPGVIELLQQRGFTVEPIISTYNPNGVFYSQPWQTFRSNAEGFETLLPEQPEDVSYEDTLGMMTTMFNYDDFDNDLYFSIIYIPVKDTIGDNTYYDRAIADLVTANKANIIKNEPYQLDKQLARIGEVRIDNMPNKNMRFLLVRRNDKVCMLSVVGTSGKINSPQIHAFFTAFKFTN
ncbi:MAG: TraB/GumN family protein [Sphingobacteriales bacterium]|nr:TraB/GumN family protein [Sphingobacteriales bacterium]